jgi:hypothetical protein
MAFDRKKYNKDNKDKILIQEKTWRENNPNKPSVKNKSKYNNDWFKSKYINDPLHKLKAITRSSVYRALKGMSKTKRTEEILGCTYKQVKTHLESQFEPWMSWDNWGGRLVTEQNVSWDIDHIIPLSSAQSEEEIYKLNHYTNLRPLCSYVNRFIKRDNI